MGTIHSAVLLVGVVTCVRGRGTRGGVAAWWWVERCRRDGGWYVVGVVRMR